MTAVRLTSKDALECDLWELQCIGIPRRWSHARALGMDHLAPINYANGLQAPGVASSQAAGPDHADLLADAALLLPGCEWRGGGTS